MRALTLTSGSAPGIGSQVPHGLPVDTRVGRDHISIAAPRLAGVGPVVLAKNRTPVIARGE